MSPCKCVIHGVIPLHLWIIKDKLGTSVMNESGGFYLHILSNIYLAERNLTFKQQYTFKQHQTQATKYFEVQATSMTSFRCQRNAQYNL